MPITGTTHWDDTALWDDTNLWGDGEWNESMIDEKDVRFGVIFGESLEKTGNLELPTEAQTQLNVGYGSMGTEFTGTLATGSGEDVNLTIDPLVDSTGQIPGPLVIGASYLNPMSFIWILDPIPDLVPVGDPGIRWKDPSTCETYETFSGIFTDLGTSWKIEVQANNNLTAGMRAGENSWQLVMVRETGSDVFILETGCTTWSNC